VPGHVNETWFKIPPSKEGTIFKGQCAELCGPGHADMRAAVKAVSPEAYQRFIERRADAIEAAGKALGEQRKSGEGSVTPQK
jgi:cytochrome c oxidase subunit II